MAAAGQAARELIRRHGEAQTQEAQEKVRKRLRIFIGQWIFKPFRFFFNPLPNTRFEHTLWQVFGNAAEA